ncbi:MAG: dynamin family protein [Planctomycetes bacterium]|nr:dynamin family protein [Planctomycetota bacterium]
MSPSPSPVPAAGRPAALPAESSRTLARRRAAVLDPAAGSPAVAEFQRVRARLLEEARAVLSLAARRLFEGRFDAATELTPAVIREEPSLGPAERNILLNLAHYVEDLEESRFLVGVVGRFKSGKSTLLNALAERDCSPVNTRVTTGVLTFTARASRMRTRVRFLDGHEEEIPPSKLASYVDERQNPENEKGVESVSVEAPTFDIPDDITYVDTPGLQAVNEAHERITIDLVRHLSAAVVLSEYPPFGLEELRFYERVKDSVAHIFLVQNLPADKLADWVPLECQTLENVLRLGLLPGPARSERQRKELTATLRRASDERDEAALARVKADLGLKLCSLDAKTGWTAVAALAEAADEGGDGARARVEAAKPVDALRRDLEASRFPLFKRGLHAFLGADRGRLLLDAWGRQGRLALRELAALCEGRKALLERGVAAIEGEILANERRRDDARERRESIANRAAVEVTEGFRRFRVRVADELGKKTTDGLLARLGDVNEFSLSHDHRADAKAALDPFNQAVALEWRTFAAGVGDLVAEAEKRARESVGNTLLFARLSAERRWPALTVRELVPATNLDLYANVLVTLAAALAGGVLTRAVLGLFVSVTILGFLAGCALGVGARFALRAKVRLLTGMLAGLLARFKGRPIREVLAARVSDRLRARFDEIERDTVLPLSTRLRGEVERAFAEHFEFVSKALAALKAKKEAGTERQELERYRRVLDELAAAEARLSALLPAVEPSRAGAAEPATEAAPGAEKGLWGRLRGLLG